MTTMSAPIAAQAQTITVGVVAGPVMVDDGTVGIALDQRPAFREYIARERVPSYTIPDRVVVGGILPESGVTIYDVPQIIRRHALSLHGRERRNHPGRTAHTPYRSGDRLKHLSFPSGLPQRRPDTRPRPASPRPGGAFLARLLSEPRHDEFVCLKTR